MKAEIRARCTRNGARIETKVAKAFHLKLVRLTWDAEVRTFGEHPELPSRFVEIKSSKNGKASVRIGNDQLPVLVAKDGCFVFVDRDTEEGYIVMAKDVPSTSFRFARLKDGTIPIWAHFQLK
jgi:hypothetical protein